MQTSCKIGAQVFRQFDTRLSEIPCLRPVRSIQIVFSCSHLPGSCLELDMAAVVVVVVVLVLVLVILVLVLSFQLVFDQKHQ